MQIYVNRNNQQLGPFTEEEIKAQLASGSISLLDHVWWEGQATWIPLGQSSFAVNPASITPGAAAATSFQPGTSNSGLALGALITGILTFVCGCPALICGPFALISMPIAIIAIVLGHLALSEIKKNPGIKGHGMAMAGLILGYIALALGLIYILMIVIFLTMFHGKDGSMFDQIREKIEEVQDTQDSSSATNSADQTTNDDSSSTNSANQSGTPPATNSSSSSTNSAPAVTP